MALSFQQTQVTMFFVIAMSIAQQAGSVFVRKVMESLQVGESAFPVAAQINMIYLKSGTAYPHESGFGGNHPVEKSRAMKIIVPDAAHLNVEFIANEIFMVMRNEYLANPSTF